jgi:hypothetical protein
MMKRASIFVLCALFFLTACTSTANDIRTSVVEIHSVIDTPTPRPTATITPTALPKLSYEESTAAWKTITALAAAVESVRTLHWVEPSPEGIIDIDLQSDWLAAESQPKTQFDVIKALSPYCEETNPQNFMILTRVREPILKIISQSMDDKIVYTTETDLQTCIAIGSGEMQYPTWITVNKGAFSEGDSTLYE